MVKSRYGYYSHSSMMPPKLVGRESGIWFPRNWHLNDLLLSPTNSCRWSTTQLQQTSGCCILHHVYDTHTDKLHLATPLKNDDEVRWGQGPATSLIPQWCHQSKLEVNRSIRFSRHLYLKDLLLSPPLSWILMNRHQKHPWGIASPRNNLPFQFPLESPRWSKPIKKPLQVYDRPTATGSCCNKSSWLSAVLGFVCQCVHDRTHAGSKQDYPWRLWLLGLGSEDFITLVETAVVIGTLVRVLW